MAELSLAEERIYSVGSADVIIEKEKMIIRGFLSEERYHDYFDQGINCIYSFGVYDKTELLPQFIQDGCLLVIREGDQMQRYKFVRLREYMIRSGLPGNKTITDRICWIRQEVYSGIFNYVDSNNNFLFGTGCQAD